MFSSRFDVISKFFYCIFIFVLVLKCSCRRALDAVLNPPTMMSVNWSSPGAPATCYVLYLHCGCDSMYVMVVEFIIPGRENTPSTLNLSTYNSTLYSISVSKHLSSSQAKLTHLAFHTYTLSAIYSPSPPQSPAHNSNEI